MRPFPNSGHSSSALDAAGLSRTPGWLEASGDGQNRSDAKDYLGVSDQELKFRADDALACKDT